MPKFFFFVLFVFFTIGLLSCDSVSDSPSYKITAQNSLIYQNNRNMVTSVSANALIGGVWSVPFSLATLSIDSVVSADFAVSGQGDSLAAWGNRSRQTAVNISAEASVKLINTDVWNASIPFVTDPADVISNIQFHTNSTSNDSYVTWWSNDESGYLLSHYAGNGNWDAPVILGTQLIHSLQIDTLGNATFLWFKKTVVGTTEISIRKFIVGTGLSHMYSLERGEPFSPQGFDLLQLTMSAKLGSSKIAWNELTHLNETGVGITRTFSADFVDDVGWQDVVQIESQMPGFSVPSEILNMKIVEDPLLNTFQLIFVAFNPLEAVLKYQIYGLTLDNAVWSPPMPLDFSDVEGDVVFSNLVTNSQGSFVLYWMENFEDITGSVLVIRCRRYVVNEGWKPLEIISTPIPLNGTAATIFSQISRPSVSINDTADIVVAWRVIDSQNDNVWLNHYSQLQGWGFPGIVSNAGSGAINDVSAAINPAGNPSLLWQEKIADVNGDAISINVIEYTP